MSAKSTPNGAARLRARSARQPLKSYPALAADGNANDRWSVPPEERPDWTNEPLEQLGLVLTDLSSDEFPDFETREGGAE